MAKIHPTLIIGVILCIIMIGTARILYKNTAENTMFFLEKDSPILFAHRGYSWRYPENTILAFRKALEAGADVLEMDIFYTADDIIVVHHDRDIQRTTDGAGRVEEMSFAELRQYDAGYSFSLDGGITFPFRGTGINIPSLEEVITEFPQAYLNLEMKSNDKHIARLLAELIKKHDSTDRILVASFHHTPLKEFRRQLPEVQTSGSRREVRQFYIFSRIGLGSIFPFRFKAFQIPVRQGNIRLDEERFIKQAQRSGIRMIYWTINDRNQMRELFNRNVCGIVTDNVSTAVQVIEEIEQSPAVLETTGHN